MNNNYPGYNNYPNQGYNPNMYPINPDNNMYNNVQNDNINSEPPKKRKWPIIILIILLLIVGILVYLNFFTDKLDFIKPEEDYEEFDPNVGIGESNSNSQSNSNSNSNKVSNSNSNSNKNVAVKSVSINPNTLSVVVGGKITATAVITPNDATNQNVTWKSSDESVATISSKGVITGKKIGTATITVTTKDGNYKASKKITVVNKAISVTGINLSMSQHTMIPGEGFLDTPKITPSNATNQEVTWTSSNTSVATVTNAGYVKAISPGTATITVTTKDGNYKDTIKVTVNPKQVISIYFATKSIYVGDTYTPSVTYYPTDAAGKSVTWKSSNTSVATVSSTGKITGVAEGDAKITATTPNGKSFTQTIRVRLNPDDYKLKVEVINGACYSYVMYQGHTFFDYSGLNYGNIIYRPKVEGNLLSPIPCSAIDNSIKTATVLTNASNKITIKVEYEYTDI